MFVLQDEINSILKRYLKIDSITNTEKENKVDGFISDYIGSIEYFKKNPEHFDSEKIPNDTLKRSVNWAFVKGKSSRTVVFIHHSDVVNVNNFNEYAKDAFSPDKLEMQFKENLDSLESEASSDLLSEKWMFGRGTADMKGGGAIQLAILKEYSLKSDFDGNIVLMIVPDEENLSAGMRYGVKILKRLKEKYKFDYKLMINSEPHQRVDYEKGVISQGSIAKMNLFVYVKGILTHAGKVLEGINPTGIMSRIISRTELNLEFVDEIEGEMSIPPTWVHVKDSKEEYDISTPESIIGYLNVLNFSSSPEIVLNKLKNICTEESNRFIEKYNRVNLKFKSKTNRNSSSEKWLIHVVTLKELLDMLREKGDKYYCDYEKYEKRIIAQLDNNQLSFIDANYQIVDYIIKLINRQEVFIVIGLTIPLYPGVSNVFQDESINYLEIINSFTKEKWNQEYMNRHYFTGISDLSYSSLNYDLESTISQMKNMLLWNKYYSIPFEEISYIQMPCINIGPWGKDFHKISERVLIEDLMVKTPLIIKNIVENTFLKEDKNV